MSDAPSLPRRNAAVVWIANPTDADSIALASAQATVELLSGCLRDGSERRVVRLDSVTVIEASSVSPSASMSMYDVLMRSGPADRNRHAVVVTAITEPVPDDVKADAL